MSAGTLKLTNGSTAVTGTGTNFTVDLNAADFIVVSVGGITYTLPVKTVGSDTQVTLISKYPGPTQAGAAWRAIPRESQNMVTAELVTQTTSALRGLNYDKQNWQAVFSASGDITVVLPDGSTFTGPSWQSIKDTLSLIDIDAVTALANQVRTDAQQVATDKGTAQSAAQAASADASTASNAKTAAVNAKTDAETAKTASETAQGKAETAQQKSEAAQGKSETAQAAAELAATNAAGTLSYILGNFQPLDPTLTALAALVGVANKLPYFNGPDTAALTALTAFAREILAQTDAAGVLSKLGLGEVINLAGGALQKNQNLADLTDKTEALENLGLGTVVSDTRLGQHEVISGIPVPGTYNPSTAIVPAGAVMTGTIQESRSNTFIFTASITYRRVQKLINGVWTNVDAI